MNLTLVLLLSGCILDRTGQSASESFRRELIMQGTRIGNLENHFEQAEQRLAHLQQLSRSQGQQEILKMESMDELRQELARLRGDVELMGHDFAGTQAGEEDAALRLAWLELRADQLEASLGLAPPDPPVMTSDSDDTGEQANTDEPVDTDEPDAGTEVTDPDDLIALAEEHLGAGREKPAEAVLNRFLELHPEHKRTAEARYRYAEAALNAQDYRGAVLRFQDVIDKHRTSGWAPWAMLRQGEAFEAQDQTENAQLFYEDVMRIWPKSKAAKEAKQKLN